MDETVSLGDTTWTAVELNGAPLAEDSAPNLVFDLEESRVAGSSGLNRLMGTFSLAEDELRFGPLATTLMAGPEDTMQREREFLDALARVTGYALDGRSLALAAGGDVVARLAC
ncbi:MAG TPA: META domain-containing protein [Gaiellaceae bacterium]|nr:META domain-containing protein [Gaiellaceae bacterium]